jgi:predicted DNA-binding transcriptional regulator YafY
MKKSGRLIYIINLIRNNRTLNAEKLAERCGVTRRTIYRDIIELSEANIPVYYDRGYKMATNTFMPPLNFDVDEFIAVKLALDSHVLNENSPYETSLKRAKAKIVTALNGSIPTELKTRPLRSRIRGTSTDRFTEARIQLFNLIEKAIMENARIEITYEGLKGGKSKRELDPYYIVFRRHAFYLIAYCHLRGEYRTFRIGRIKAVTLLGERFIRDGRFTLESYFKDSWEVFTGPSVDVEIRFTGQAARIVATGRHHKGEKIRKLRNGDVIYKVTTAGTEEISLWLRQFGAEAKVVKPDVLKSSLAAFYSEAAKSYK